MPVQLVGLDRLPPGEPAVVVSALHELGAALHVLGHPEHHDAGAWPDGVRHRMGQALRRETEAWAWTTSAIRSRVFLRVPGEPGGSADPVAALAALADEPARLTEDLLRPLRLLGDRRSVHQWAESRGPEVLGSVEQLVGDPAGAARRFVAFLQATEAEWWGEEWRRVEPGLRARATRLRAARARHGVVGCLTAAHPAFERGRSPGSVVVAKVQNSRHAVDRRGLVLAPSALGAPHLYLADVRGQPLLALLPEHPGEAVPGVAVLHQRLAALANPGRPEVARAIASESRTAAEVAALWGMDPTAVTRHLRALAAAGLATPERRGRYVRYLLDPDAVRRLGGDVLDLLRR